MQRPLLNRLVFLFALVGMFIAIFLWKMHATPEDIPCGASNDCRDIARSPYSRFPVGSGPPVAMWGTFGYVVIAMLALARTSADAARGRFFLLLNLLTSLVGMLFSLRLTLYEYQKNIWCKWCVASQVLIALIFFLTLADWLLSRRAPATTESNA